MEFLLKLFCEAPSVQKIKTALQAGKPQAVYGLSGTALSFLLAATFREWPAGMVIVPDEETALTLAAELKLLWGEEVFVFLPREIFGLGPSLPSAFVPRQRLLSLAALARRQGVVVATAPALLQGLAPPENFSPHCWELWKGEELSPEELGQRLVETGYVRVSAVEVPGQFARRGGIVDFFPPSSPLPVRVEFDGDEIARIATFDPASQRSQTRLEAVKVEPAVEVPNPCTGREILPESWFLSQGEDSFPYPEVLLPCLFPRVVSLLAYLPPGAPLALVEAQAAEKAAREAEERQMEICREMIAKKKLPEESRKAFLSWSEVAKELSLYPHRLRLSFLPEKNGEVLGLAVRTAPSFLGKFAQLAEEIQEFMRHYRVILLVDKEERVKGVVEGLKEYGIIPRLTPDSAPVGTVTVVKGGNLREGFIFPEAQFVLLTPAEIFGRRQATFSPTPTPVVEEEREFKPGEYVVHPEHGIGIYRGLVQLSVEGVTREYALIQYAGEDRLYLPADQLGVLERYVGGEGAKPRLSRLGGGEWKRVRARVKQAATDVARELLRLYAMRETAKGHAFSPDTPWQREFEAAFPYEETPDQLRAIADVKADMEKPRPMDRLICGDVGFGKTEIALRAAFKAVMDGKQVAVLVPTTILAQQHYRTFSSRFAPYPIRVAWLCRFQTPAEQREVIKGLKAGTIDIVIGTHRLLQNDVQFRDLGLVIIDEEQRFGVLQKEKLKLLRKEVDVLTLTATPIPRTLYMSLVGLRDTSCLTTPPPDRLPVETYVVEEDPAIIREAIRRELARGGQVYFVYNRVAGIVEVANWVKHLVPEARVAYAHGQMPEAALERIMLDFIDHKYDVLVATTIVENGLDIGNVNTLIVKDADQLGLSQLYQLRGRVGRTNRLAYAYFLYRRDKIINEAAKARLRAIKDFTSLGAGFKVAKRDLEIRGAGNLLGTEQHGHIQAVGLELYCRLLQEAIKELKGEEVVPPVDPVIELTVSAYIPDDYVPFDQKLEIYQELSRAETPEEVEGLAEGYRDRYGPFPPPFRNLLAVARLRAQAKRLRLKLIGRQGGFYRLVFAPGHQLSPAKLVAVADKWGARFKQEGEDFVILLPASGRGPEGEPELKKLSQFLVALH
ncbi:transcription-repair coupling factor [Ammonifex degensii KC4]|uniref:Transcription-repair-coupling factor n=1 Tax=Ammonifex degensii (strain DSM 10501 / KC4) TaxID=429009 RepID=C9RA21_AMMDK|nr:transcription-repair coupling factor [Ammonifex degensii]ACX53150.1 transcription-repair coupling factor [Ammonifex degensii KC4]